MDYKQSIISQIDSVLAEAERVPWQAAQNYDTKRQQELVQLFTRIIALIERTTGPTSAYRTHCDSIAKEPRKSPKYKIANLLGVLGSLRADVQEGFIARQVELIHGELFADFLEMAQHLLDEGYKEASAVIAGSSLESHLRQLCLKNAVDPEYESGGMRRSKKASMMNDELKKAGAYTGQDHKNVTCWLGIRNSAAHAKHEEYTTEQVGLTILGIRDFITRHPA